MSSQINSFIDITNSAVNLLEVFKNIYLAYLEDSSENALYDNNELTRTWNFLKECIQNDDDHALQAFLKNAFNRYINPLPDRPFVSDLMLKRTDLIKCIGKKLNLEDKNYIETSEKLIHDALFQTLKLLLISYEQINDNLFDELKIIFKHNLIQQIQRVKKNVKPFAKLPRLEILTPDSISSSLNTPISFKIEKESPSTGIDNSSSSESQIPTPRDIFKPIFSSYPHQTGLFASVKFIDITNAALKILDVIQDICIAYIKANQDEVFYDLNELTVTWDFLKNCVQNNDDNILREFLNEALKNYVNLLPSRPFVSALLSKRIELIKCIRENLDLDTNEYLEISKKLFNDSLFLALKSTLISHNVINDSFFNDLKSQFRDNLVFQLHLINYKPSKPDMIKRPYFIRPEILSPSPNNQSSINTPISIATGSESLDINIECNSTSSCFSPTPENINKPVFSPGLEELSIFSASVKIEDGYDSDGNEVSDIFILMEEFDKISLTIR